MLFARLPETMWWASRKLGLQGGPNGPGCTVWAPSMNSTAERIPVFFGEKKNKKFLPTTLAQLRHFMHHPTLLVFQTSLLIRLGSGHTASEKRPQLDFSTRMGIDSLMESSQQTEKLKLRYFHISHQLSTKMLNVCLLAWFQLKSQIISYWGCCSGVWSWFDFRFLGMKLLTSSTLCSL